MPEQAPLRRRAKRRAPLELYRAPDVVQEGGRKQEVRAQARVKLRSLATQRGDADGVLEEPAGIAVVPVGTGGGQRPERCAHVGIEK